MIFGNLHFGQGLRKGDDAQAVGLSGHAHARHHAEDVPVKFLGIVVQPLRRLVVRCQGRAFRLVGNGSASRVSGKNLEWRWCGFSTFHFEPFFW